MFKSLMTTRRFAPLFWCQFLSALNDNFVKNALVILILFKIGHENSAALVALAGAVLVAPFFILSGIGGELADRYDKAEMAEKLKRAEIPIALVAALGLCPALGAAAVSGARALWRHRGPVRSDQVRHPAGAARRARDSGRQRLHRKRDVRRHPHRHHRRRAGCVGERGLLVHRRARRRACVAVLVHGLR